MNPQIQRAAEAELRLLLIERDSADEALVRDALQVGGVAFRVDAVASFAHALESISKVRPDVILLSAAVHADGGEAELDAIRSVSRSIPFVLLVDSAEEGVALSTLRFGPEDYVPKDRLDKTLLLRTILHAIERASIIEALRVSEADYRGLFEHAPHGIYRSDGDGNFIDVNTALVDMLGYGTKDEVLALNVATDVYVAEDQLHAMLERCPTVLSIRDEEVQWTDADGRPITVRINGRFVCRDDGSILCFEGIAEDITQRRSLEDQLRQSQKMEAIGQLTGGIAHEINNILSIIIADVEFVERDLPAGHHLRGDVGEIRQMAVRGGELVKKLLGFSRRQRLTLEVVDLHELVRSAVGMLSRLVPEFVRIEFESKGMPGHVNVDRGSIEQILFNLTTNARDALPSGGEVSVTVAATTLDAAFCRNNPGAVAGEYVCLRVVDNGCGMDKETQRCLFEPFFSTKPPGQGTGLGMSTVYGLIKQQGGFIAIKSAPGEGTSVSVFFRRVGAHVALPARPPERPPILHGSETILLVEDEPALRRAGRRSLERFGYNVLVAGDGLEGIEVYRQHDEAICAVVTDIVMPRMGGPAMIESLRGLGYDPAFILTSGYRSADLRKQQLPHDDYIHVDKPWNIEHLLGVVREVCDLQAERRAQGLCQPSEPIAS